MSRKTKQMIYTRPNIITEAIRLTAVRCGPFLAHYAIFDEDEAQERLASGFWVDHPEKLSELDKLIAEAAEKEAQREKREADETQADVDKREQQKKIDAVEVAESERKLVHATDVPNPDEAGLTSEKEHHEGETVIAGEQQPDHVEVEPQVGEQKDDPAKADDKKVDEPKGTSAKDGQKVDGQKVDGQKVDTKAKAKK